MAIFAELKKTVSENQVVIGVGTAVGVVLGAVVLSRPRYVTDLSYTPNGDILVKYNRGQSKVVGHPRG